MNHARGGPRVMSWWSACSRCCSSKLFGPPATRRGLAEAWRRASTPAAVDRDPRPACRSDAILDGRCHGQGSGLLPLDVLRALLGQGRHPADGIPVGVADGAPQGPPSSPRRGRCGDRGSRGLWLGEHLQRGIHAARRAVTVEVRTREGGKQPAADRRVKRDPRRFQAQSKDPMRTSDPGRKSSSAGLELEKQRPLAATPSGPAERLLCSGCGQSLVEVKFRFLLECGRRATSPVEGRPAPTGRKQP